MKKRLISNFVMFLMMFPCLVSVPNVPIVKTDPGLQLMESECETEVPDIMPLCDLIDPF